MAKALISVIIPVYNEEKYIQVCLRSLFTQTRKPADIIVVDDGSCDGTCNCVRRVVKEAGRIAVRLVESRHHGPARARNLGVKYAQGQILVFLDGDMKFSRNFISDLTQPILAGRASATFTRNEFVANLDNTWARCWNISSLLPFGFRTEPTMENVADNFRAIKKELFVKTAGYKDTGYGEDTSVLTQLPEVKAIVAARAVCYHFNPDSLSDVYNSAKWMGKSDMFQRSLLKSILAFSFPNSLRKGMLEAVRHRLPPYLLFKCVFDLGVVAGVFEKRLTGIHYK